MILGYKQYFPWGKPTCFRAKIRNHIYDVPYSIFFPKDKNGNYLPAITVSSRKIHSIREDSHSRWKPGMKIHHAHGVRTKNYDWFAESICMSTQSIEIRQVSIDEVDASTTVIDYIKKLEIPIKIFEVYIDNRRLSGTEFDILAKNDGFDSTDEFFLWFNKSFKGKIIHWTDYKY